MKFRFLAVACALITCFVSTVAAQDKQPLVEPYLMGGKLGEGEIALKAHLQTNPNDDQARFGLGVLQFLQGVEHLGVTMAKYELEDDGVGFANNVPFLRFPVANDGNPQQVELKDIHEMLQKIVERFETADNTLAGIQSNEVKLPIHLFQINLDFNGDGILDAKEENFHKIIRRYFGNAGTPDQLRDLVVNFDKSDVYWLQAYSHLLRGMCELVLAYDQSELWDVAAHHVFKNTKLKYEFLQEEKATWGKRNRWDFSLPFIADAVASVHNLRFELKHPERVKKAGEHIRSMVRLSGTMWDSILAETDNDREWLPAPEQQSAVTRARITKEQVVAWREFLEETQSILDGKMLIPFWRGTDATRGVNLKKFFDQPADIDVVLWFHGSAATDYLEKGNVTSPQTWGRFQRVFEGDFIGFAAWIN